VVVHSKLGYEINRCSGFAPALQSENGPMVRRQNLDRVAGMKQSSTTLSATAHPSHEQISRRAEELWRKQGSPANRDEEIWLEAERQLAQEGAANPRAGGTRRATKNGHGGSTPPMASR
jgi:hypothetical protein